MFYKFINFTIFQFFLPIDTWWLVVIYIGNGILIAMFVISNSDDFVSIQYKDTNTHLWYEDPLGSKVKLEFDKSANSAMKRHRYVARLLESHMISTNKFYNSIVVIFLRNFCNICWPSNLENLIGQWIERHGVGMIDGASNREICPHFLKDRHLVENWHCHDDDNGGDGDDVDDDVYGNHLSSELIIAVKLNSVKLLWKHLCWTVLSSLWKKKKTEMQK